MEEKSENDSDRKNSVVCTICDKRFSLKTSLAKHCRLVHKIFKRKNAGELGGMRCPLCKLTLTRHVQLIEHLENFHKVTIRFQTKRFSSLAEFEIWKHQLEKQTNSSYTQVTGVHKIACGIIKLYFTCHRSYSRTKGVINKERKRASKSIGPNYIGGTCPSRIDVEIVDDKVMVYFVKTHVGHKCEVGRLRLSEAVRHKIADKLRNGASASQIVEEFQNESTQKNIFDRTTILTQKDVQNVKRDLILKPQQNKHKLIKVETLNKQLTSEEPNFEIEQLQFCEIEETVVDFPELHSYDETNGICDSFVENSKSKNNICVSQQTLLKSKIQTLMDLSDSCSLSNEDYTKVDAFLTAATEILAQNTKPPEDRFVVGRLKEKLDRHKLVSDAKKQVFIKSVSTPVKTLSLPDQTFANLTMQAKNLFFIKQY